MFTPVLLRTIAAVWFALLIVGSLQPVRPSVFQFAHRGLHWVGFAGAALLVFPNSKTRRQQILSALTIFIMGLTLEILQHLIYRNPMEWRDLLDDGLAIILALGLYSLACARNIGIDRP